MDVSLKSYGFLMKILKQTENFTTIQKNLKTTYIISTMKIIWTMCVSKWQYGNRQNRE